MREGFYRVIIEGNGIKGVLIGTLCDGRITGSDRTHRVAGVIREKGSHFSGTMTLTRYQKRDDIPEIAHLDRIDVTFSGFSSESFGQFEAKLQQRPDLNVKASFQYLCPF